MVFVSHRLDEVVEIAERVTVLRDGRKVGTWPVAEVDARRIGELMTGSSIEHSVTARDLAGAGPLLEVRGLSRAGEFADVVAHAASRRGRWASSGCSAPAAPSWR